MTADELLERLHDKHGNYLAEITVERDEDGTYNVNVALSTPSDEPIGLISYNARTLTHALEHAVNS